ncbi:MAG TPA: glycosyltransferase [Candidatus Eisenbacteria bacterium]|nr:glycosyltransferase [Candidatus Eisenbacteria bacterium]
MGGGPMRVLELLVSTDLGGGPAHVRDLIAGLAGPEFQLTVAGPAGGTLIPELIAAGADFVSLAADRLSPGALRDTIRLARARRIQVIHSHGKGAGLYGRIAARLTGAASVHTLHGIHPSGYGGLYLPLERALSRRTFAVVHVSESQATLARTLGLAPAGRTRVIVNGIDAAFVRAAATRAPISRAMLGLRPDALVLATVARFDPVKRLEVLLRALPLVVARVPEAQLLVVGDGPERDALHALARTLALGDRVVFAGAIPDAARVLPLVDLYLTASRREGLPTALLEAMACGVPVLATEVPGHVDAVEPEITGRLVPPDDVAGLAAAAARLLRDPALRARMGQAGRERVERHFTRARMLAEIAALYREAAGFPAGSARSV